jgi:hypothetical protein
MPLVPTTWIYGVEVTSYVYSFPLTLPLLRGAHQLHYVGLATVNRHVALL